MIIFTVIVLVIVVKFLSWSLWNESILERPHLIRLYWTWQISVMGAVFLFGILGFRPRVKVVFKGGILQISQGHRNTEIDLNLLKHCRIVSALEYYREWDHQADRYMTRIPDDVLLIFSDQRITAIGVKPAAHEFLLKAIRMIDLVRVIHS